MNENPEIYVYLAAYEQDGAMKVEVRAAALRREDLEKFRPLPGELGHNIIGVFAGVDMGRHVGIRDEPNTPLVHVMLEGQARCGTPGPPSAWPEGTKHVPFYDKNWIEKATCVPCIREQILNPVPQERHPRT